MTAAEKLTAELVKIYEDAFAELEKKITAKAKHGRATAYERSLLRQVKDELKKLKKQSAETVKKLSSTSYRAGLNELMKEVGRTDVKLPELMMSGLNKSQINLIAENLTADLNNAVNLIGRRYNDAIRKITLQATAKKLSQGQTIREMQRQLTDELKRNNVRYVEYADGKKHSVKSYAEMAAHSTTAEAQNKAKIIQGEQWGYDLVRMTKHQPTCSVCAMYQDRVYALTRKAANGKYKTKDGKPIRFSYLYDTALCNGYDTIHPNCRHRLAVLPANAYTTAELMDFSRQSLQPFEDNRTDDERKRYAEEQAVKRRRRESYNQYNLVKSYLPNDAPKTFAAWQRMRNSNSQNYRDLMSDYRYIRHKTQQNQNSP